MNPLNYLKNMTSEDVQRIARTLLQFVAGALVTHGAVSAGATWIEPSIGVGVAVITFAWQLYGNRLNAKLAEIAKMDGSPPVAKAADAAAAAVASTTAPKVAALIAILILGALIVPTPGYAQTRLHITGKPIQDIKSDVQDATVKSVTGTASTISNALAKPFQDLAAFLSSDATAAVALSTQIPALQDGHGQQCWMAMSTAGDVFKAHPVPLTLKVMTDVEALRLLAMTANNLCANVHCTQVFADLTSMAQAASPTPLPIPGLHDLCSKIPQIAQVAAVTVPTPAAVPAETPATTPAK